MPAADYLQRILKKFERGDLEGALALCRKAVKQDAGDRKLLDCQTQILARLGHWEAALEGYERLVELAPEHIAYWSERGQALVALERLDAALASFDRALAIAASDVLWYKRAEVLLLMERYQEAALSFEQSTRLNPQFTRAHYLMGAALYHAHKDAEALQAFEICLEQQADSANVWFYRGLIFSRIGQFQTAVTSFEKVLSLNPDYPDCQAQLETAKAAL